MNSIQYTTAPENEGDRAAVGQQAAAQSTDSALPSMGALMLAGAGALALGALGAKPARAVDPPLRFADIPGTGDIKVLNFALALEDLEAEFYVQALQRLTGGGSGGRDAVPGLVIPGLGLGSQERDVRFMTTFGRVEREHRDFLRATIGAAAIRPFKYRFGLQNLNRAEVLNLTYTLEQGGTSAYLGAIPFFATKQFIPIAAAIQGTEARHTAIFADILNDMFGQGLQPSPPQDALPGQRERPIPPDPTLAKVSPFIVVPQAQ